MVEHPLAWTPLLADVDLRRSRLRNQRRGPAPCGVCPACRGRLVSPGSCREQSRPPGRSRGGAAFGGRAPTSPHAVFRASFSHLAPLKSRAKCIRGRPRSTNDIAMTLHLRGLMMQSDRAQPQPGRPLRLPPLPRPPHRDEAERQAGSTPRSPSDSDTGWIHEWSQPSRTVTTRDRPPTRLRRGNWPSPWDAAGAVKVLGR